jgi:hypothetical protein
MRRHPSPVDEAGKVAFDRTLLPDPHTSRLQCGYGPCMGERGERGKQRGRQRAPGACRLPRAAIVLVTAAVGWTLVAGCGAGAPTSVAATTSARPTSSSNDLFPNVPESSSTTTSDPVDDLSGYSKAQLLYLKAHEDDLEIYSYAQLLALGKAACKLMRAGQVPYDEDFDGEPDNVDDASPLSDRDAAAGLLDSGLTEVDTAAVTYLCPKLKPVLAWARAGLTEGPEEVGGKDGIKPGSYTTTGRVSDCYWERVSARGNRLANDFVTFAPKGVTVIIRASDGGFDSQGCGAWLPVTRP